MIERLKEGWSVGMVGAAFHQSDTTVRKWWRRYRAEGSAGLHDRSSRPNRFRRAVAQGRVIQIIALRRKAAGRGIGGARLRVVQERGAEGLLALNSQRRRFAA
jgi:transposase-like protein